MVEVIFIASEMKKNAGFIQHAFWNMVNATRISLQTTRDTYGLTP